MPAPAADALVAFLALDGDGTHRTSGSRVRNGPLFGGELLALGLRAAAATVDSGQQPHALHAHFLARGRPERISAEVATVRDGRTLSLRQVSVEEGGAELFTMMASFHRPEERDEHASAMPPAPDPDGVGPWKADPHTALDDTLPFEIRHVSLASDDQATIRLWARVRGSLPVDPVLAACAQAMATDMRTGAAASAQLGSFHGAVSLDHAMWFHRSVPADDWFLIDIRPRSVAAGRGLVVGTVHGIDGRLAATFAQEALVRAAPD